MSGTCGKAREQSRGAEVEQDGAQPSDGDLMAVIEHQRREIAALKEKLRRLSADECSASVEKAAPSGHSLGALQRGLTTVEDVRAVGRLCEKLVGQQWERLQQVFFEQVVRARDALPERVLQWEDSVAEDWFKEPWYMVYAQDMAVEEGKKEGDFDSLRALLPYLKRLGFDNLCILAHYESPMADGGFDVSRYETRESLGGEAAFSRFMDDAYAHGIRVGTEGVFSHTSTEHEWFKRALRGEERYINYYVQRNGREKIGEMDRDGEIVCRYRDADGTISEHVVMFPDVDRTHGLWVEIN
ncbi:unnamed protein product, partial [Agarophyton chilense]